MKYKIFAICDPEQEYAARFANYARERANIPMDIRTFTGVSELYGFMKDQSVEILLLSARFLRDDTHEWPAETIVILDEHGISETGSSGTGTESFQAGTEISGNNIANAARNHITYTPKSAHSIPDHKANSYARIYKYRSAREIVREVMSLYGAKREGIPAEEKILKPVCKVIGIYSPVSRCYKTTFALVLGQILAREKPTLYLNFEEFSGLGDLLYEHQGGSISDVIYMMRQGERDLIGKVAALVGHAASLDFVPPSISGQELRGVTPEEWHELIREIADRSSYEAVVLDLGSGLGHLDDLLTECDVIYVPVRGDFFSGSKLTAFEKFLHNSGAGRVAGRIKQVRIRGGNLPETRDRYIQQAVWSDVGDLARECIRRDGL